ncbi:MAG: hypothetical protein H7A23_02320 [Leptospiraceae bacterium]|nr:hypothetical protein [Leptospiraceae bacterium]
MLDVLKDFLPQNSRYNFKVIPIEILGTYYIMNEIPLWLAIVSAIGIGSCIYLIAIGLSGMIAKKVKKELER